MAARVGASLAFLTPSAPDLISSKKPSSISATLHRDSSGPGNIQMETLAGHSPRAGGKRDQLSGLVKRWQGYAWRPMTSYIPTQGTSRGPALSPFPEQSVLLGLLGTKPMQRAFLWLTYPSFLGF